MSNFHLIRLTVNDTHLLLVDPNSKPRYMCFVDPKVAQSCIDHVATFRSKHGIWPCFDMSESKRQLSANNIGKSKTPEMIKKYMELDIFSVEEINEMARKTNISFYSVLSFSGESNLNVESINLSGQELDGYADPFEFRDLLEFNLKIS